jgi:hypothetical protein
MPGGVDGGTGVGGLEVVCINLKPEQDERCELARDRGGSACLADGEVAAASAREPTAVQG